jgi:uncharacterized protein (TIGR00369 family)
MFERARTILAQQPLSVLLGAELIAFEPGLAELALPLRAELRQQHGFAHGGAIAYLADNALTFAAGTVFDDALTLEMKLNYVRPARGTRLVARATVVHAGKRQAVVRCDVFDVNSQGEQLCAVAQGTISRKDPMP